MTSRPHLLLDCYRPLRDRGEPVVMATIIETAGSTYQKAGARSLITADGRSHGLLSGGCFENDLFEQAAPVFAGAGTKQIFYDMRSPDDALWGLGLGCNGAVRVLLQLLTADSGYEPLNRIDEAIAGNRTGVLATVCESTLAALPEGRSMFIDTRAAGDYSGIGAADRQLMLHARRIQLERRPALRELIVDGQTLNVFYEIIEPPPELLVIGAGPDAVPVARLAVSLGWRVTLVDHRPAYLKTGRFPEQTVLLNRHPEELRATLDADRVSAAVLMTHNFEYDARYLETLAATAIPYIGLLGPAARRDRLLDRLGGSSAGLAGRVFGPVGLDLGAGTPEEIALSIVAEAQTVMKQRSGLSLSGVNQPIQARAVPN